MDPNLPHRRLLLASFGGLLFLLAWDTLALDLPFARAFGSAAGFALRDHWLLSDWLHDAARRVGWMMVFVLALAVARPFGILRRLSTGERAGLLLGVLLALAAVSVVKNLSRTSCPWELAEFGGVARYVSHWQWGVSDGGSGRCFPGGHASAGFAFMAGYFWLRGRDPRAALGWLALAAGAGVLLGVVQQVRGAHYMSHTLWTAWICWITSATVWFAGRKAAQLRLRLRLRLRDART